MLVRVVVFVRAVTLVVVFVVMFVRAATLVVVFVVMFVTVVVLMRAAFVVVVMCHNSSFCLFLGAKLWQKKCNLVAKLVLSLEMGCLEMLANVPFAIP